MDRPLRLRIAHMLLIKDLIRSGALTREQASAAVQEGSGSGPSLPRVLLDRGWVSPQRMNEALAELTTTMRELR
jgi:hypothetical protein